MADMERSFLEAKERDELVAIAGALGLKPAGRSKKDTLIEQIMTATGVGPAAAPSKSKADTDGAAATPVRKPAGRKPKVVATPELALDDSVKPQEPSGAVIQAPEAGPTSVGTGDVDVDASTEGRGPRPDRDRNDRLPRNERSGRNQNARVPRTAPRPAQTTFDPFADVDTSGSGYDPAEDEWAFAAAKPDASGNGGNAGNGGNGGNGANGDGTSDRQSVATPSELRDGAEGQNGQGGYGQGGQGEEGFGGGRRNRRDRFKDRDRNREGAPQGQQGGGQAQGQGQQGGGQQGGGQQGPREPRGDRPDREFQPRGDRPDRGGFNQPAGNSFGNSFDGEGRNKRRRRGKDRDRQVTAGQDAVADRLSENYTGELIDIDGFLDLADQGYGYIRAKGYLPSPADVYVPVNKVKQYGLRKGDKVIGKHRPATAQEKFPAIVDVSSVNGHTVEVALLRPKFEDLTPLFPDVKLVLEQPGQSSNMVARIIDLVAPIGKGQRGLIVSPPKAGKTTIMKQIAASIEGNNPGVHLMVLLIDERPEEVTDMRRHVKGEVVASTFDKPSDEHTMVAELALERAKRLVEEGRDVVIILDGITRLARAYNLAAPATGRIMSGGIDTGALYPPKKFFGAARNTEEGGSLTILATALIETGSTMDTVIFEEFKGTGNLELRLDRRLAEKRIYPAINVNESSTRHEELLFSKIELDAVWKLRRVLNGLAEDGTAAKALELLMDRIKTTRNNMEFLTEIAKAPGVGVN